MTRGVMTAPLPLCTPLFASFVSSRSNMSLSGQVLCFTGDLTASRAWLTAQAEAAGATVSESVTDTTTHLVVGPGAEDEVAAAVAKGVTVWTEDKFLRALGGGGGGGGGEATAEGTNKNKIKGKRAKEEAAEATAEEAVV